MLLKTEAIRNSEKRCSKVIKFQATGLANSAELSPYSGVSYLRILES
jgi:hypothetical protein